MLYDSIHANKFAGIAKRLLPGAASIFSSDAAQSAFWYGELGAAMLRGKGSGSGWDIEGEIRAAMKFLRSGATVFDVGANVGEWSRCIERDLRRDVQVYLFEPQPVCCEQLKPLVASGAVLTQAAVGEIRGKLPLYTPGGASGLASLHVRKDTFTLNASAWPYIEVDIITLDEFIEANKIATIDFMKMDIEGNEPAALRGASKALEAGIIKALSFEFGSANLNSRTYFRDLWDLLTGHHYKFFRVLPGGKLVRVQKYNEDLEYFRGATNYIAALT